MSKKGVVGELERENHLDLITLEYGYSEARMSHLRRKGYSISRAELKGLAKGVENG